MSCEHRFSELHNNISNGLYTLGETIGRGHFAVVKLARHVFTQREVAVKVIDKAKLDKISKDHLSHEVQCMKLVQHPNVVRLYEVIDTPTKLYLILEFADGGDMYDYLLKHANGLNEWLARKYFRQICRALKYCHAMYVCHRDLKPENLVFFEKQGVVKLTDFGFSNLFSPGKKLLTSCGSLAYSAPEILLCDEYDAPAVDIWSLGVILFMLVTGHAPFQEASDYETARMILSCSYTIPTNISNECQNLIDRMIVREPQERATLDQVVADKWCLQYADEDEEQFSHDALKCMSQDEQDSVLKQMVNENIADRETILTNLNDNQYNYITATYYLLAEKMLQNKMNQKRTAKCSLQPPSDTFREQTSPVLNSDKENVFVNEQFLTAQTDHDEDCFLYQQRNTNANLSTTQTQAMNMILEEDENPESPPTSVVDTSNRSINNFSKLNKIIENDENDQFSLWKSSDFTDVSATPTGILNSKDLYSFVETKRRHLSHSCSSSDSEDNESNNDLHRSITDKHARSRSRHHEFEFANHRYGRSLSNVDRLIRENQSGGQQPFITVNPSDCIKRNSSMTSADCTLLMQTNEDAHTDVVTANSSIMNYDYVHSLSSEHRLANPSQISVTSRTSLRHSTPRESTVFTKTDVPNFIRLLQQKQQQDTPEPVQFINESNSSLSVPSYQECIQASIIVEEEASSPLIPRTKNERKSSISSVLLNESTKPDNTSITREHVNDSSNHVFSSTHSLLSRLKYSLIIRQQTAHKAALPNLNVKAKHSTIRNRTCCSIS